MNLNKVTGAYQVFREGRNRSPWCTKRRETIGRIDPSGKFTISRTFVLQQKLHSIEQAERQKSDKARTVAARIQDAVAQSCLDTRKEELTSIPLSALVLGSLMMALTGDSDCVSISDYISRNREFFCKHFPGCEFDSVSHDTVRRCLMMLDPEKFETFYQRMISPLIKQSVRQLCADGQAIRATGNTSSDKPEVHGASMIMNFYDATNRVTVAQKLIAEKTNEITVGPKVLEGFNLFGTVVTADAMSCQYNFVRTVVSKGGDYCISLKGNQETSWREVIYLFNSVDPSRLIRHESEWELDHGRIEKRTTEMLTGSLLSKEIWNKWYGLASGAIVRVRSEITKKSTGKTSVEDRYYITSLPALAAVPEQVAQIIRSHWSIENKLHWTLDNLFRQDRMQADCPSYIENRSALNKLALALLEHYRFYLWDHGEPNKKLSLHLLQERCRDPQVAIECIGRALGWLH